MDGDVVVGYLRRLDWTMTRYCLRHGIRQIVVPSPEHLNRLPGHVRIATATATATSTAAPAGGERP